MKRILWMALLLPMALFAEVADSSTAGFCEKFPDGGGVRHLEVVSVMPGKLLVMTGGLGPLQSQALSGSMSIGIAAAGDETKLSLTYAVAGYVPPGANAWAVPVNGMLSEQFTRLKNYIEHGTPETK